MPDWEKELTPDERQQWEEFVEHYRRSTLQDIAESSMIMSLVPRGDFDVKFALELGTAIMLDKPIIAVAHPSRAIPEKLRRVVDEWITADLETEEGQEEIARRIKEVTG